MAKKSISESEFNALLVAERSAAKVQPMIMTHPPSGASKSLDEMLREHADAEPIAHQEKDVSVNEIERDEKKSSAVTAQPSLEINRDIRNIPVSLIDANSLAPREVYTPAMIARRAEELRTQGQHDPIHVIPNQEVPGRFIIADGWTRVQACRDHKVKDTLLAEIHHGLSLHQAAWFGYEQNEGREQHCDLDRAMFYERLIASGENAAEIARRANVTRAQMTYFRSFAKLPTEVLEIIRASPEKFGANASYNLLKLYDKCGLRRTLSLAMKFDEEGQTVRWLVNQVQGAINPGTRKAPATQKTIRYLNGYFKVRANGFDVSIDVPNDQLEAFEIKLEALLDSVATRVEHADKPHLEVHPDELDEPSDRG
jgi:ParB family transcriptional regulator, chromosome partitioning protein